jgi:hypothetical protein
MQVRAVAKPKGDRVKITMSGKFLPYKYYGASGNVPEYGFKEDSVFVISGRGLSSRPGMTIAATSASC